MGEGNLGKRSEKSKGTGKKESEMGGGRKSREGEVWAFGSTMTDYM